MFIEIRFAERDSFHAARKVCSFLQYSKCFLLRNEWRPSCHGFAFNQEPYIPQFKQHIWHILSNSVVQLRYHPRQFLAEEIDNRILVVGADGPVTAGDLFLDTNFAPERKMSALEVHGRIVEAVGQSGHKRLRPLSSTYQPSQSLSVSVEDIHNCRQAVRSQSHGALSSE